MTIDTRDKQIQNFTARKLWDNEVITGSIKGFAAKKAKSIDGVMQGRVILTNERVCYYRKGILGDEMESIALAEVKSIETDSSLGVRTLNLFSAHNKLSVMTYQKSDIFEDFSEAIEQAMRGARTGTAQSTSAANESPAERLKALAELKDSGILTQDEFDAKRAEILSQL